MLPQLEDGFEDARDLAVRLLGGHQLIPRLQQMAEFTVGELQSGIERGYQLLVGARALDCSRQREVTEDRGVRAGMEFGLSWQHFAVGQGKLLTDIAGALQ